MRRFQEPRSQPTFSPMVVSLLILEVAMERTPRRGAGDSTRIRSNIIIPTVFRDGRGVKGQVWLISQSLGSDSVLDSSNTFSPKANK